MATTQEKANKAAQNQALFRDINERIGEITARDGVPSDELWAFVCECSKHDCMATISLRHEEYEAVRRVSTHFPVKPGHDDPEIERLVEENERYAVVEKFGDAGTTAVELDPRRSAVESA